MSGKKKPLVARLQDTDLTSVEHAREMGLSDDEYARAQHILAGRVPNKVELGCIAAMWSEHCSYKSSRVHLRKLPTTGPRVLIGPGENAGVVDIGEGLAVAFKVESHNHPSYIEPYQGAATGVGGILRDVFTMGARPIAAMNLLRFGRPAHEKTPGLVNGVVRGIGGYGNCFGVPTVYSNAEFDAAYDGNILVNAFALGVLRHNGIFLGKAEGTGNPILYAGAKTGRDGIHGATMASDSFSEGKEQERPTVQVGDPFKEKLLVEACLECFRSAPEEGGLLVGIQDMGAAGLTSSSFEMASRAGSGVVIDVDCIPARETGMTAYEFMLSESQERMLLVAKQGKEEAVRAIFAKWDLDCVEIGRVTDDGNVRLRVNGADVACLPARELADEAPRYERPYVKPPPPPADLDLSSLQKRPVDAVRSVVLSPTLAPKTWIYRQYDREVGAGTLFDGTSSSSALVRIPGTGRAVALALCCDARQCALDPREGARRAVAEGVLRTSAQGAVPIGVTDCLNFGSPLIPEVMGQVVEGIEGIADACRAFDVPVVSGNVSLYNQTDDAAILPTPTIGVVGLVEAFAKVAPPVPILAGAALLRVGEAPTTLHGSFAAWQHAGRRGSLPTLDLAKAAALAGLVRSLRLEGLAQDARPVLAGGLAAAAFDLGRWHNLAPRATLPAGEDFLTSFLGEDRAAFVVVVAAADAALVLSRCAGASVSAVSIGTLGMGDRFVLQDHAGDRILDVGFAALLRDAEAVIPAVVEGRFDQA